jgi:hypothetical protein
MAKVTDSKALDLSNAIILKDLIRIMKERYKSEWQSRDIENKRIVTQTNALLRTDLVSLVLKAIRSVCSTNFSRLEGIQMLGKINSQAYLVFFCLYQTQAEEKVI